MKRSTKAEARRTRWTEATAEAVLDELKASGRTLPVFARERGLHPVRLSRWRRRLASRAVGQTTALVPVTVNGVRSIRVGSAGIVVEVGAARVEVHDYERAGAAWVAELVRLMGAGE
jgi:hypothetical protein